MPQALPDPFSPLPKWERDLTAKPKSGDSFTASRSAVNVASPTAGVVGEAAGILFNNIPCVDPKKFLESLARFDGIGSDELDLFWGKANGYKMLAGRDSGSGHVLVTTEQFDTLKKQLYNPIHTLTFAAGKVVNNLQKVLIKSARLIGANVKRNNQAPYDDSVYLLELGDARWLAQQGLGTTNRQFNILMQGNHLLPVTRCNNWSSLINTLWSDLPTPAFGMAPIYDGALPTTIPVEFRFLGVNTWDCIINVLEHLGWTCVVDSQGQFRLMPDDGTSATDKFSANTHSDAMQNKALLSSTGPTISQPIPETIRVYFHNRFYDYTYEDARGYTKQETPHDAYQQNPVGSFDYATKALTDKPLGDTVVSDSVRSIWITAPALYYGQSVDDLNYLKFESETIARFFVTDLLNSDYQNTTFSSYLNLIPGGYAVGVAFYDLGDGPKTQVLRGADTEVLDAPTPAKSYANYLEAEYPTTPNLARPSTPYFRWFFGEIKGDYDQSQRPRTIRKDDVATVDIMALVPYSVRGGKAVWDKPAIRVQATLFFDVELHDKDRVVGVYDLRDDTWVILGVTSSDAQHFIQSYCVPYKDLRPVVNNNHRFRSLIFRRNPALRLFFTVDPVTGEEDAVVDIGGGPSLSVYTQGLAPGESPKFGRDPIIGGSIQLGLIHRPGQVRMVNEFLQESRWGPPQLGHGKTRMPNNLGEAASGKYLIAQGVRNELVQTKWFGPGIYTEFSFYGYSGSGCKGTASCISVKYENGLLTRITGAQFTNYVADKNVVFPFTYHPPFDPCDQSQQPGPSPNDPAPQQPPGVPAPPPPQMPPRDPPPQAPQPVPPPQPPVDGQPPMPNGPPEGSDDPGGFWFKIFYDCTPPGVGQMPKQCFYWTWIPTR